MKTLALAVLGVSLAVMGHADSHGEDDLFGGGASAAPTPAATASPDAGTSGDAKELQASTGADAFASGSTKEDPLQIGGTFYQQYNLSARQGENLGESSLSEPLQVDVFLDGRPNDRVRTYVAGRLIYDASKDSYGNDTSGKPVIFIPTATAITYTVTALPKNPQVVLDQAWVKFDAARVAFLTLGKQHVKWGTGRIWNPTDALNAQHRDPLQPYDLRLGSNMLNVQVPWEAAQANVYAMALLDNPNPGSTVQQNGGAFRIEGVVFGAELGIDAITRAGQAPRYGADLSTGLGPVDVYVETAVLTGSSLPTYEYKGTPAPGASIGSVYAVNPLDGHALQSSAGMNYSFSYAANRSATIGGEYFYNELGSSDAHLYPVLLYLGQYQPLYTGKHYGALYLSADGLDAGKKTSYNVSTLSNLTDASYVTRFDFNWLILDYLSFGANVSAHYGIEGGEFNFALHTPALSSGSTPIAAVELPRTPFEGGVSLRMAF